ncbi:MAG: RNA polymerase sigma factor [Pseudomonadota bacterium]
MTNELELVERMLAGEQSAFDCFFNGHAVRLASFAARRCALDSSAVEDVVQQTMINALRNLRGFRGESSLFTWLCQICRHVLADIRRKAARQPAVDSLDAIAVHRSASVPVQLIDYRDPLEACNADSTRSAIRKAVNDLPPRYGRILELKYGDELPVEEIARILGLSESAAQSLLARARRAFGECWSTRQFVADEAEFHAGKDSA